MTEPGYYENGNFGIRLENVLIVKDAPTEYNFGEKGYLAFEHVTWVCFILKYAGLLYIILSAWNLHGKSWMHEL